VWGGTQFRVAVATRVRCAATIFTAAGLVIGAGAANAVPLPGGNDPPLSSPSVVPRPPIATPTAPTATSSLTRVASNTHAHGTVPFRQQCGQAELIYVFRGQCLASRLHDPAADAARLARTNLSSP
jgi:hypothetical protein